MSRRKSSAAPADAQRSPTSVVRPRLVAAPDREVEPTDATTAVRVLPAGLHAPRLVAFDPASRTATILLGQHEVPAAIEASVDERVLATALARGERVIVACEEGRAVVLGVLRTTATPGVDEGDDFVIRARRVAIHGAHEVSLRVGASSLVMRALGHVEIASKTLVARAEGAQRFFARMIHMN